MPMTQPHAILDEWRTILGANPRLGDRAEGRDLWPVTAECGASCMLKRLGPWRNLPLADEARVLAHLSRCGISVAEFIPTDRASLYAGELAECFVLMPRLEQDAFDAAEVIAHETAIGNAVARLHLALARYPWPVNSYTEDLAGALHRDLMLPPDLVAAHAHHQKEMIAHLASLPVQMIHGDLTPDNILLRKPGIVSGFIDFDHLPTGPRLWDIGKYLSRRIRLRWRGHPVDDATRLAHLTSFLAGYHQLNPLTPNEISALPAAIAAGNFLEASYHAEISAGILPRRRMPDHDAVLADTIEAARWHLTHDHHESIAAAVRAGTA
ncbi:MAG: phosphotransferase [Thermomicrobiales bacterium]